MTIEDDRLYKGTLTFGPKATPTLTVSCQATAVTLEPKRNDSGDKVETLCGDSLAAAATTDWSLKFTGIQDWKNKVGFVNYAFDHDGEVVDFQWKASADGPTWEGSVTVAAVTIGGDVNKRITSDAEWPCNGKPTRTDVTPPSDSAAPPAKSTAGS